MFSVFEIEGVRPVDASDFINIPKAFCGDQSGASTTALQHGVNRYRGAVKK